MGNQKAIILVGASVRAAAQSAVAAGFQVHAFDLFADRDLCAIANATQIRGIEYPHAVPELLQEYPPDIPWMYTGGMENHPDLIETLCRGRPLWGNDSRQLGCVRDRGALRELGRTAGWQTPQPAPSSGKCIVRPLNHCGGFGIRSCDQAPWETTPATQATEQYIRGECLAGVFLGNGHDARLLGVTRQQITQDIPDHPLAETHPFAYCGSIGPIQLSGEDRQHWGRLGQTLASAANLVGLFGVDTIRDPQGNWYLLEVNPRYTASIEVLEIADRRNLFTLHAQVCERALSRQNPSMRFPPADARLPTTGVTYEKRIHYADADVTITEPWLASFAKSNGLSDDLRDIPQPAQTIRRGQPLLTELRRV